MLQKIRMVLVLHLSFDNWKLQEKKQESSWYTCASMSDI